MLSFINKTILSKFLHIPSGHAHNLTSDTMMQALVFLVSKSGTCVHITKCVSWGQWSRCV